MSALSGPQRNTINAATPSAEMKRPVGCFPDSTRLSASARERPSAAINVSTALSWTGVFVVPGQTALHVMPWATVSSATARVRPISAVLLVT